MCKFFSLVSDGKGNINYFNKEQRKERHYSNIDSHSSIIESLVGNTSQIGFFTKGDKEEKYNKYEYNPLTKELTKDTINVNDDYYLVREECLSLDFKTIVPELIVKDIVNPINIIHSDEVSEYEIDLLKKVIVVRNSVRNSVGGSVGGSVRDSVGDSVWGSVRDSIYAYVSSFFDLKKWKYIEHKKGDNPFQPYIDLWELGLIPSFDGKVWRLHNMSNDSKVIYESSIIWR